MIRKYLQIKRSEVEETTEKNMLSFVASTSSVDRYGDIVMQNWQLDSYKSNPIVLFNHDQQGLPIGKGIASVQNEQLMIDIEFDMDDPTAAEIARKAKNGFLNAVSVGFQPLEFIPRSELPSDHASFGEVGNLFTKSELLEVSIVTIPAQSEAVAIAKSGYGEFTEVLKDWKGRKAKTSFISSLRKHILRVEETEDRYIVHFAKEDKLEEEIEEEIEEEEEAYLDELLKDGDEYDDDDDKKEKAKDDVEEAEEDVEEEEDAEKEDEEEDADKEKRFNTALIRALTLMQD